MYLLLDIGGTKTRVGISLTGDDIDKSEIISTPESFEQGIKDIKETALSLTKGKKISSCAVAIREILDSSKSKLVNNPSGSSFPDWIEKPIKKILKQELDTDIFLENDAALAGLGEATWGAGSGKKIVAYITVSTGLGGAKIVDGMIDPNSLGFEPGDLIVNFYGELVYLGDLTSGSDLQKKYGLKPENIEKKEVWHKVTKALAIGLYNVVCLWSPEIIVLGGGMMKSISLEDLKNELEAVKRKYPTLPPLVKAKLGDSAGLYGALEYLKQQK